MSKLVSIFPFIKVEQSLNILGSTIQPGEQTHLNDLEDGFQAIIRDMQSKLFLACGTMDNFSIVLSPEQKIDKLKWNLRKIADFLRFRLSYTDEDIDYDQGLFITILSNSDGSIKLSINGGPPTILNTETFPNKFGLIESKIINIAPEEIPKDVTNTGLSRHFQKGFEYPNMNRFWRALDWYSKSFIKDNGLDERHEIICLAVAFEALLNLPEEKIKFTFQSLVSNLFGESDNLVKWASDFYNLRSKIVHGEDIILDKMSGKKSSEEVTVYFRPREASSDLVKSIDVARPVFRDFIESLSLIYGKKKQYDYDDIFFIDKKRIERLGEELRNISSGFDDEDDIVAVGAAKQELRGDGTLEVKQIHYINTEFARVLGDTFSTTSFAGDFNSLYSGVKKIKADKKLTVQIFTNDSILILKNILAQKENLPYKEGLGPGFLSLLGNREYSNLFEDVIELALEWFRFVKETLYEINE